MDQPGDIQIAGLLLLKYWQYFSGIAADIAIYLRYNIECGIAILLGTFFGNTLTK
jgi:hypothetical protein